ncbi:unnamed protein product [Peniophora sp. CBMAI 1063]|nr:unnamed protein product [Peniophora sp. CBMAI 1063]
MGAHASSSSHPPPDLAERLAAYNERLAKIRQRIGDKDDIEDVCSALRRVEKSGSSRRPPKAAPLRPLGVALYERFERLGVIEDIDDAIWASRSAAELGTEESERYVWLHDLGKSLRARFEQVGDAQDIHESVTVLRRAVELTPDWYPDRLAHLNSLGNSLHARFDSLGDPQDLEDAILTYRRVIELTPDGYTDKLAGYHNLGSLLQKRYKRFGELDDLEQAISMQRRAAKLADAHPAKPAQLNGLGISLHTRFVRLNDLEDLEESIRVHRRAVDLTPANHPDRIGWLQFLAVSVDSRSQQLDDPKDLEEAIKIMRHVTERTPDSHPAKADRLHFLGVVLHQRFRRTGELGDLEEAIIAQRKGLGSALEGHPMNSDWFNSLGRSLQSRFRRLGEPADLDEAISMHRRAVDLTPEGHPDRPGQLNNLGTILSVRFDRLGELGDLDDAIANVRAAANLTPEEHPSKATMLSNLGVMLRERFIRLQEPRDLDDSVAVSRRAVESSANDPQLASRLNNLGNSLRKRAELRKEITDVDAAISAYERAIDLTPDEHPNQSIWLLNLGWARCERYRSSKNADDYHAAVSCFMKAATHPQSIPTSRLAAAEDCIWLLTTFPKHSTQDSLLAAHACVFGVVPEIVWLGHGIQRRYSESSRLAGFIGAAAAAAVGAGELGQAVEWLEAGRALVWAQILALRTPLDELQAVHPKLADELRSVQQELRQSVPMSSSQGYHRSEDGIADVHKDGSTADRHRGLAIQYDNIMKKIRRCPGFEDFLRPKSFKDLVLPSELAKGPVVFINVHPTRCDALVLHPGGDVACVPLPGLSTDRALKLRALWTSQLRGAGVRVRAALHIGGGDDFTYTARVLKFTWEWIVQPILQSLQLLTENSSDEALPLITWCPTGPLTQVPLHAAGIYTDPLGPRTFNYVVSSYTPSLSALHRSYEGITKQHPDPRVLIVTQPATPKHSPLPGTKAEGIRLQEILSHAHIDRELLNHDQATIDSVSAGMSKYAWVHLACHGVQHPDDATKSAFALYDGHLTLSTLMSTAASDAELAFLSACQTATGDENNPEEAAHLAAGMLAVGFKGVVATMWSIGDREAPVVVEAYYQRLLEMRECGGIGTGRTGAAYALHEAVRVLREKVGENKVVKWAPFVHFGI